MLVNDKTLCLVLCEFSGCFTFICFLSWQGKATEKKKRNGDKFSLSFRFSGNTRSRLFFFFSHNSRVDGGNKAPSHVLLLLLNPKLLSLLGINNLHVAKESQRRRRTRRVLPIVECLQHQIKDTFLSLFRNQNRIICQRVSFLLRVKVRYFQNHP